MVLNYLDHSDELHGHGDTPELKQAHDLHRGLTSASGQVADHRFGRPTHEVIHSLRPPFRGYRRLPGTVRSDDNASTRRACE